MGDKLSINDYDIPAYNKINPGEIITINPSKVYQNIDGLGFTLTESIARKLFNSTEFEFDQVLKNVVDLNINIIKLYLCSSNDFYVSPEINESIPDDKRKYVFIILDKILAIKSDIKLIICPTIPTSYIKHNKTHDGGYLKIGHYNDYAEYLCSYLKHLKYMNYNVYALSLETIISNNPSYYWKPRHLIKFVTQYLKPLLMLKINNNLAKNIWYGNINIFDEISINNLKLEHIKNLDGFNFYGCQCSFNHIENIDSFKDVQIHFTQMSCTFRNKFIINDILFGVRDLIIKNLRNGVCTISYFNLMEDSIYTDTIPIINDFSSHPPECHNHHPVIDVFSVKDPYYYVFSHIGPFLAHSSRISYSTDISSKNVFSVSWTCYTGDIVGSREKFICLLILNNNNLQKNITIYSSQTDKFLTTLVVPRKSIITAKIKI